jgi:hypothetical protein
VTSAAGTTSGIPFAIDNYRNTNGFMAVNNDVQTATGGNFTHDDAKALFGSSQTDWTIIVTFESPFCAGFLLIADAVLDSAGQCFGMSLASLRFVGGQQSYGGSYALASATLLETDGPPGPNVWQLAGPPPDNPSPLTKFIHQQHLAQLSVESIDNWLNTHNTSTSWSAADLHAAVQKALAGGFGAMITLMPSLGTGHAVVAFDMVDRDDGNFDLLVYNCNVPFNVLEDTNPQLRSTNAAGSIINVTSGGAWTFSQLSWTGTMIGITVIPWGAIPAQPTAPFTVTGIATLLTYVVWAVFGAAKLSQVTDGESHFLLANDAWNMDSQTALAGVAPMPNLGGLGKVTPTAFVSKGAGALTHTVTGSAAGSYNFQWVGSGRSIALTNVAAVAGTSDTVVTDPTAQKVGFTAGTDKALSATLIGTGTASEVPRTATLTTTAAASSAVTLSFDPAAEAFTYIHSGASTTYTLEFASFDAQGKPTTFLTSPTPVVDGAAHTVTPNWSQLAGGLGTIQIRAPDGSMTNSPMK